MSALFRSYTKLFLRRKVLFIREREMDKRREWFTNHLYKSGEFVEDISQYYEDLNPKPEVEEGDGKDDKGKGKDKKDEKKKDKGKKKKDKGASTEPEDPPLRMFGGFQKGDPHFEANVNNKMATLVGEYEQVWLD